MMEGELANRLDDVYGILNGMEINNAVLPGDKAAKKRRITKYFGLEINPKFWW